MKVSVRDLAAFAGRAGDLGSGHFSLLRGIDGIRAHQRAQKNRGPGFEAEVTLRATWRENERELELQGRADGVETGTRGTVIEEIKTTRLKEGETPLDFSVHRLQVMLYAWIWWKNKDTLPAVRLRYLPPDRGEGWTTEWQPGETELCQAVDQACRRWVDWHAQLKRWRDERDATLRNLPFPFAETRTGQTTLMEAVDRVFHSGGRLHAEAPTGTGKTLAVLVPALRALGKGQIKTLFVATCRNSGKSVIEDALCNIQETGAKFRALTLVARDRVCRETGSPCDCATCPLALGFFDRLPKALADLRQQVRWDGHTWQAVAARHRVCPFAFHMQAAREADLLLGDLNYALDPTARLAFLFDREPETVGLLIDEAHHLPERAREMYSAELDPTRFTPAARKRLPAPLQTQLSRVRRAARSVFPTGEIKTPEPPLELAEACRRASEALEESLGVMPPGHGDPRGEWIRMLRGFWLNVERHGPEHVTLVEENTVKHLCLDAAKEVGADLAKLHAAVLFSATLAPLPEFRHTTGASPSDRDLILPSPFDPQQFKVSLEASIPVVWRARGPQMYDRLTERIRSYLEEAPGKAMVFLPSFNMLEEIQSRLPTHDLWLGPVLAQPRGLQEADCVAFLAPFRETPGPVTGLAVLGGALNEGIDLPGEALTTVVVVGIGLPAVTAARELLRAYYHERGEDGFVLAYTVPGLMRVRQALGRVIRGPSDRGRALLIDPRFQHPFYRVLM